MPRTAKSKESESSPNPNAIKTFSQGGPMWRVYLVKINIKGKFAAALPNTPEAIEGMLRSRMPDAIPENAIPIDQLIEKVESEVGIENSNFTNTDNSAEPTEGQFNGNKEPENDDQEVQNDESYSPNPQNAESKSAGKFGYATFKRFPDTGEFYYEGRCIRGHIKDIANVLKKLLGESALKARIANRVYVQTENIPLGKSEPDGTETRYIQAMTMRGPISTIKFVDYLIDPELQFTMKVLNDGDINDNILHAIFDYGGMHGLGQERSQGWGRYTYTMEMVEPKPVEK